MTTHASLFASFVYMKRKERGYTIKEVSRRTGLSPATCANIEKGQQITLSNMVKVLYALGLTLMGFAFYVDNEARNGNYTRE